MEKKLDIEGTDLKVLILEDSLHDLELIQEQLFDGGYKLDVIHVDNEQDYTHSLLQNNFKIILSDFKLPDFNAFEALKISNKICPEIPFICVSGSIGEETAIELLKLGAVDYVLKDKPERLPFAIKRALEEAQEKAAYQKAVYDQQRSEEKYRFMFDNNPQPNWIFDVKDLSFLEVNEAAINHYGYSKEEFLSMTIKDIRPDEDIPMLMDYVKGLGSNYNNAGEWKHVKKNGELIIVEIISHIVLFNGKEARHVLAHDITRRKQIELELHESETNFRRSISESPVGIRIVSVEGKTIYANKAFLDIYDFDSLEEFTNTPTINRYTPESYAQHQERKKKRENGNEVFEYEISIVCKNNNVRHVKVSRKEILWNGTKHFQVINIDVTEQRNAEEQLRKLSKAVEQSPDAICITNPDGIIEYVNPRTIRLTGFSADELINQNARIFGSGEKPKDEYAELWRTIKSGNIWNGELHNKKKNGELYWESTTISPIFDTDGQITHFLGIKEDITERKQTELALNISEKELHKFASHLQHVREEEKVALAREIHDDLGQILVALKIDMGLLKQKVIKTDPLNDSTEIVDQFNNLVGLIDNTLKTARRIMNGLRPEQLEILGFIGAVKAYLQQFEERHQLSCKFFCEKSDIVLNPQQALALFRILQEALNNIIKHAKASLVKIQLNFDDDTLIMEIADNGVGFDKNNSGRQDSYGMIGMKERVVLLEGKLDIISEVGHGTCVRVQIPFIKGSLT